MARRNRNLMGVVKNFPLPKGHGQARPKPKKNFWNAVVRSFHPVVAKPAQPEVPKSVFATRNNFRNALERKGYERLGGGWYSSVFAKPGSDKVIKIGSGEDNWIDYTVWGSQKGYAGRFAPKVYSYKKFKGTPEQDESGDGSYFVAVMERMDKTLGRVGNHHDEAVLQPLIEMGVKHKNTLAMCLVEDLVPGLGSFAEDLGRDFPRYDLHAGNIMMRSDGSICVTDPVASPSTLSHITRLRHKDFTSMPLMHHITAVNDNKEQENCHADYRSVYS